MHRRPASALEGMGAPKCLFRSLSRRCVCPACRKGLRSEIVSSPRVAKGLSEAGHYAFCATKVAPYRHEVVLKPGPIGPGLRTSRTYQTVSDLRPVRREGGRALERQHEARLPGDAGAGDVERGSMIDRHPHNRKAGG